MGLNIWLFNHYVAGPGDFGITRHFDMGKQLVKKGHNVTIFASSFNHWEREEKKQYNQKDKFLIEYHNGVRFVWIKTVPYGKNGYKRIFNILSYWLNLRSFKYEELNEKPDVVLGSIMHHLAAWVAYKVAKKFNAKFIFEERDLWPESLIHLGGLSRRNPIVKILDLYESFMYKKADKIIVLFDKAPIYVKGKGVPEHKIVYLPNGAEVSKDNNIDLNLNLEIEKHENLFENKIVLGYTGSLSRANNMERLINLAENFKDNKDFFFVFVGEGSYKVELIEDAKKKGLNNCLFLPPVSKKELPSVLNYFDYGIISLKDSPLYKWGFSLNKLYDYMSASLPIIMDTSLEDNIINENKIGITSSNLEVIKSGILAINKDDYKRMSNNSREYLLLNHDWSKLSSKFEKEVLGIKI